MTALKIRTRKARRSGGQCSICNGPLVCGQPIAGLPIGWAHSHCAAHRTTNHEGDQPMAAGDVQITVVGNLVEDPNLRFTASGQAVASFRIASTPRFLDKQTNEWKDGDALFLGVNVWRQAAENCAESLTKGMRVIVQGRLKQRQYETKQGEKRTVYEIEVDEIGPCLKNATAKVAKTQRQQGGGFGGGQSTKPAAPSEDPWANRPADGGGFSDQPPF